MMIKEIEVELFFINETKVDEENNNKLVAKLENGMSIDLSIKNNGLPVTKTSNPDLIEYLECPLFGALRYWTVIGDGDLLIRQYQDSDLVQLKTLNSKLNDAPQTNLLIRRTYERSLNVLLKAVEDHKAELFILEYRGKIIGQVVCELKEYVMHVKPAFYNNNSQLVELASRGMRFILRRLYGKYDFYKFVFDPGLKQEDLFKALKINTSKIPYELSTEDIEKDLLFYIQ